MWYVNQLLFYPFYYGPSLQEAIFTIPLEMLTTVKRWSYWKFVLKIKETPFMKTQNSKIFRGSMHPDPPSKKRLRRLIVNRASNIHLGTPPCKKAGYTPELVS